MLKSKMKILLILLTFAVVIAHSQHRILTSPEGETFHLLNDHKSATSIIKENSKISHIDCDNNGTFGYPPYQYPSFGEFGGFGIGHRSVEAMRYEAYSNGEIDSLYFIIYPTYDGRTVEIPATIRIFKSNIYPNQPHGTTNGNYYLPWGYYLNTNDLDMGITPYHDESTDTHWISANQDSTWDPLGEELWGLGGYPLRLRADADTHIIGIDLGSLGYKPELSRDEPFWICIRNELGHQLEEYYPVLIGATFFGDRSKPWRNWKFIEHDFFTYAPRGWVGLNFGNSNIWYTMTLNYPPPVMVPIHESIISGKLEGEEIHIELMKFCAPEYLDSTGIAGMWVDYRFDKGTWDSVQSTFVGDTMFTATIPGKSAGTFVELVYRVIDGNGVTKSSTNVNFRIAGLHQNGYSADTSVAFSWVNAESSGYAIPYENFFLRSGSDTEFDDGTAGPYDLGYDFYFFGSQVRYAWIGINGGLALSSEPTDTLHLNSNSFYGSWTIPGSQQQPTGMPKNFIAPFYTDLKFLPSWWNCDNANIYISKDANRFIIEWRYLVEYANERDCRSNFEVILDKRDSSITFLYNSVGEYGLENNTLIGFEADTNRWFLMYQRNQPELFMPRNGKAFKFTPSAVVGVANEGVAIPLVFHLFQNYPNPFNPTTMIIYELPKASFVTLKIYNLLGQVVQSLVNEHQGAGRYSIEFSPTALSSGIYFYRLTAGTFTEIKKLLFLQ